MCIRMLIYLCLLVGAVSHQQVYATSFSVNIQDKASLQRGAKLFMNYCSGCHSLKYLRYDRMAKGLGLMRSVRQIDEDLLKNNLIFTQATITDPIEIAMPPEDAKQWFGIVPPDLSLVARAKGEEWIYNYLTGFYNDDSRPFGTNNYLVPDVAMPNILDTLHNKMGERQFDENVLDLVTFLAYVSEPIQTERYHMGFFVIGFLGILFLVSLCLKIVYWRKIGIK
ncbi:cytochrome c1 [Legionella longbeachae]|uniref:Putative ubiquinol-cytochrome c oxydoreductase, cytochrome c1 n=1 Tax=Legionella longbeachae serogroup 1 (strain NSW150) TaxID=661367 RepID=D3HP64_LEGLN|nr:cytochrome c1 [Legionella longbeachae]VEE01205.1 ubiquinol-cytochrome c oxydoreductase, cytochrome c1 [Legionella oakridgensis]HBD7398356.1 cytochrome c1 [Legionella pneumophila]ARB92425.1 cytochrome c1 [Legionella longbeachae]ARM34395.1 cytochrome c1 [Legionella longbeachae]EEZ96318.1 cytochrome c1 family [Legionella longbeachae D-4968]